MSACLREREGVGGQEAKKTRERKGKTSVVVVAHEKPQPVVCLALVCLLCGVCVASVVCVSGRRGERWQAPLWQCG